VAGAHNNQPTDGSNSDKKAIRGGGSGDGGNGGDDGNGGGADGGIGGGSA